MLGPQAKREVQRARFRTTMAMQAQAREQGRYLGGRPPYGYRLVDAGPHPNRAHAQWGRRPHRLDPDPHTAPHVTWISSSGSPDTASPASPAPSTTGPYPAQDALPGVVPIRRLAVATQWAVSTKPSHPALVSDHDFIAAQAVTSRARPTDGSAHTYLLVGLLHCGDCGRSVESQWSHGNPCYRCRHGHTTAHLPGARSTRNLHLRQDVTLARLRAELEHVAGLDSRAQQELMKVRQRNEPSDLVTFLRRYEITIACHRTYLKLQTNSADLIFAPVSPDSAAGSPGILRQRTSHTTTC